MAAGLAGGKTLLFSVDDETFGYVQSYNVDETTERAEARGPDGHVYAVQEYNDLKQLTLNYIEFATSSGDPAVGATFSFDNGYGSDVDYYISSVNHGKTVDGFKTVDVTATNYPNLGTPDA